MKAMKGQMINSELEQVKSGDACPVYHGGGALSSAVVTIIL
jgi:hypothetical protein